MKAFFWSLIFVFLLTTQATFADSGNLPLRWMIKNSSEITGGLPSLFSPSFRKDGWIEAETPSTVLAAVLKSKPGFDPFLGTNLKKLDLEKKKYQSPWWYRTEFSLTPAQLQQAIVLHLKGVNYSAEVFINGKKIRDQTRLKGMYRIYELDLSQDEVRLGQNTLAILVTPPKANDLTANWVDWNPHPADENMGLWREAYLSFHDSIQVHEPWVETHLNLPKTDVADLKIQMDLTNRRNETETGSISISFHDHLLTQVITLQARETKRVVFNSEHFPELKIKNPRLWWPKQMGKPEVYTLSTEFQGSRGEHEKLTTFFGIREVTSELTEAHARLFRVNGKPIQIRGGGYASDLFLRFSKSKAKKDLQMLQELNLNTVRLEGMFQPEYFYNLADRLGILVMPGWVCCNSWENQKDWTEETYQIAKASLRDQLMELRAHPSVFTFLYGSDEAPPEKLEKLYLAAIQETSFPNPTLAAASDRNSKLTGKTGVKMSGPYDYVGPTYWLQDKSEHGGAWGFNTETSPGPAMPRLESLKQFIPKDHLWPVDEVWNFHAGLTEFKDIHIFKNAQDIRYGPSSSVEEFSKKSQLMTYDNERAMFEAYAKNKYSSATGIVQWMLNNAWPSLIWHLYDYYYRTGGAYFGVKKANESTHIQFSYDDRSVVVVNHSYEPDEKLKAKVKLLDFNLKTLYEKEVSLDTLGADSVKKVLVLPEFQNISTTHFLQLKLTNETGKSLSENFYWLSSKKEIYDWSKTEFNYTPMKQEADLRLLNQLPRSILQSEWSRGLNDREGSVKVRNTGKTLAFFIELRILDRKSGKEVSPVLWDDQYFSLLPGEEREVHFKRFSDDQSSWTNASLEVEAFH